MDWVVLEVAIGLSFLFFVLSIVASAVNEAISAVFKLRARTLEKGIANLVTGSSRPTETGGLAVVREIYASPLVTGYGEGQAKPSYLASRSFRNALFSVTGLFETTDDGTDPLRAEQTNERVLSSIRAIPHEHLRGSLLTIWESANEDAQQFRAGVERWFDRGMERVSGWYKRRAQVILFALGLVTAVLVNANAITAADRMWSDGAVREALVAQVENQDADLDGAAAIDRLEELSVPIGWDEANRPSGTGGWLIGIGGWLVMAVAISFGAPFWFDVLNKFANMRSAGKKPDSTLVPAPTSSEVSTVRLTVASDAPPAAAPAVPTATP